MEPLSRIRKRQPGKLANTSYVNEVAEAVAGRSPFGRGGQDVLPFTVFPNVVVRTDSAAGGGVYNGVILGGEMSNEASDDFVFPQGMSEADDDTIPCIIFVGAETGRSSNRFAGGRHFLGVVIGYTSDGRTPLVLVTGERLSDKHVRLEKVGGTDGDDSNPPSYTYDVFDWDDFQLNSVPVTPLMQRANGEYDEALIGIGREMSTAPGFELAWCDEVPKTDSCEGTTLSDFYAY